jgi:Ion transport protein
MELFAFKVKKSLDDKIDMENGLYPLNNFNTFYESLLTMFVLLTGDQWSSIMLDYYRGVSPTISLIFFISFMILG